MTTQTFKPSPRYLTKMRVVETIVALLILAGGALMGWAMSHDPEIGARGGWIVVAIWGAFDLLWWLPGMILAGPYYDSLSYEIAQDEVIVHVGIFVQSVKHVPYRTVTNVEVNRDIFDRWFFGLGSLQIQTAGMSGKVGAEESLKGLDNVQEAYALVAAELRRFRGAMLPTAVQPEQGALPDTTLAAILAELRAIRQTLEGTK